MRTTLVTGANGFVGGALCNYLEQNGLSVVRGVRRASVSNEVELGNIEADSRHEAILHGCDAVVHLAARVHVMHETAADPLMAFREVNAYGTLNLARQAAQAGARRFVFLSTAKVNGEAGFFSDVTKANPQDPYAISKWEAEGDLQEIGRATGMEIVILRPPLVYGPGVAGNFLQMMRVVDRGIPLPLAAVTNRRSLIYIGNLVDVILRCLTHPEVSGKTYFVSDAEDVSTPDLIRKLSYALGCSSRLVFVPPVLLRLAGRVLGKNQEMDRLLGTLTVDCEAICNALEWRPPFTLEEGLRATAGWYRQNNAA